MDDSSHEHVRFQFGLARLFQFTLIVAVVSALFASLKWPVALLVLCGLNIFASIYFYATRRVGIAISGFTTACLILATLFFTDWGFSSLNPTVRIAWPFLAAACVSQLYEVLCWLISDDTGNDKNGKC